MKRVKVKDLTPGMIVAEDIYNFTDQLVLSKGTVLNEQAITRLSLYSVLSVKIDDEAAFAPTSLTHKTDDSYLEKVRSTRSFQFFHREFNQQIDSFRTMINDAVTKNTDLDVSEMLAGTMSLVERANNAPTLLNMLHTMRDYDDCTYVHSVNVALLCNLLAGWMDMSEEYIQLATLCGLLHDIGKLEVPDEILNKPGRLSMQEYQIVQEHARKGFERLKDKPIDEHIKNAALMHHERCDGSGYPLHLTSEKIDYFAKMVAITDVYDAMTSPRPYRDAICPFKVIAIFEETGFQLYDPELIMTFLTYIANSYVQTTVQLTDGRKGKIVYINKEHLSKPTVQIGKKFVDLSMTKGLHIESMT